MNKTLVKLTPTKEQRKYQEDELIALLDLQRNTFTKDYKATYEAPSFLDKVPLFNTDLWAENLFKFGFKKVILNCKLSNGLCLWKSDFSKIHIDSKNTSYDLVNLLSKSCKKFGLKFGVFLTLEDYISLDISDKDFDFYYLSQLKELMTKYNNISEIILDKSPLDCDFSSLDFENYFKTIKSINPKCIISTPIGPDVHYTYYSDITKKDTFFSSINLKEIIDEKETLSLKEGDIYGDSWVVGESIYSLEDCFKGEDSLFNLKNIYNNSLGRNSNLVLLLNPKENGDLKERDINLLKDFSKYIKETFSKNLIKGSSILATNSSCSDSYNLIDDYKKSYWIANENAVNPYIEIDFKTQTEFNILELREWIAEGQNVEEFKIYAYNKGWFELYNGTSIGYRHIAKFNKIKTDKIKISFTKYKNPPLINHIGAYLG